MRLTSLWLLLTVAAGTAGRGVPDDLALPSAGAIEQALGLPAGSLMERARQPAFYPGDSSHRPHSCEPAKHYRVKNDTELFVSVGICSQEAFRSENLSREAKQLTEELNSAPDGPRKLALPVPPKAVTLSNGLRSDVMTFPVIGHGLFLSPTIVVHSADNRRHLILQVIIDDGVTSHPVSYFKASLLEGGAQILGAESRR